MSSSQDNNKRGLDGFGQSKGGSQKDKKNDKAQKTARAAVITVIAVAILFAAALFMNSDFLRQKVTAVSISNVNYTLTDFNYYYKNVYLQYYQNASNAGGLAGGLLPDTKKSLKSQVYDETTGETWAQFFEKAALEQMKSDNQIIVEAQKAGYQLSEDDKKKVDSEMESGKEAAISYGYPDLGKYLKAVYGKGMTEVYYRKALERSHLVDSYTKYVGDSFVYSAQDLEAYYTTNKDSLDTFSYRYFLVTAKSADTAADATQEQIDAAKKEAVTAAGDEAKKIAATITDEQSFINAARSYDPETYNEESASLRSYRGELLGSTYGDWLKDSARKTGDVSTFESANGYYVVYFISRSDNHYATVNAQTILVQPEQIDPNQYADDQNAYNAAVEEARKTAESTANSLNDQWVAAGATQDKMTELTQNNLDKISADASKLQENIYRSQLPAEVENWLYDSARVVGDHTVVYSESVGYYIVYFAGPGKQYSDVLAENGKRSEDLKAWKDALPVSDAKKSWLVGTMASM
jgi:hypothetical protein